MDFDFEKALTLPELIESMQAELKRLNELKYNIAGADPSKEFISGGPQVQCRFEEIIVRIDELEKDLEKTIKEHLDYLAQLHKVIDLFDGEDKLLLRYLYLDRLSLEQIAVKMGYTKRNIYNKKEKVFTKFRLLS